MRFTLIGAIIIVSLQLACAQNVKAVYSNNTQSTNFIEVSNDRWVVAGQKFTFNDVNPQKPISNSVGLFDEDLGLLGSVQIDAYHDIHIVNEQEDGTFIAILKQDIFEDSTSYEIIETRTSFVKVDFELDTMIYMKEVFEGLPYDFADFKFIEDHKDYFTIGSSTRIISFNADDLSVRDQLRIDDFTTDYKMHDGMVTSIFSRNSTNEHPFLRRYDSNLKLMWERKLSNQFHYETIDVLENGNIIIGGQLNEEIDGERYQWGLVSLHNSNGVWLKSYKADRQRGPGIEDNTKPNVNCQKVAVLENGMLVALSHDNTWSVNYTAIIFSIFDSELNLINEEFTEFGGVQRASASIVTDVRAKDDALYGLVDVVGFESDQISFFFKYELTLSSDDKLLVSNFNVYPNPTFDVLNIEGEHNGEYMIYNSAGQLVLNGRADKQVDVDALSDGLYFMHLIDNKDNVRVSRFVKN